MRLDGIHIALRQRTPWEAADLGVALVRQHAGLIALLDVVTQHDAAALLAFQAEQNMRLQSLLVAGSRAEAIERAREMEARAAAQAEHQRFFQGATSAHPGARPWQ